jgi:hypothetical protein
VLELTVFAAQGRRRPYKVVGGAGVELRVKIVRLLTERVGIEELLAKTGSARRRSTKSVGKTAKSSLSATMSGRSQLDQRGAAAEQLLRLLVLIRRSGEVAARG